MALEVEVGEPRSVAPGVPVLPKSLFVLDSTFIVEAILVATCTWLI